MFSWATSKLESLVQTVAPPPNDSNYQFLWCCQQGDEKGAMQVLLQSQSNDANIHPPIDPIRSIIVQLKGQTPIHLACLNTMHELLEFILARNDLGEGIWHVKDIEGNTPLHCACMSNSPNTLNMIKRILTNNCTRSDGNNHGVAPAVLNTSLVGLKNSRGETPYDVAQLNSVRQYLLPIQLQAETQAALENGGAGLAPGIDLGGLKIQNSALPPPPSMAMIQANGVNMTSGVPASRYAPPPMPNMVPNSSSLNQSQGIASAPSQNLLLQQPHQAFQGQNHPPPFRTLSDPVVTTTPPLPSVTNEQVSCAPSLNFNSLPEPPRSGGGYALVGRSSAAIYSRPGGRVQPNDGFHSSSSDKNLQAKYGNENVTQRPSIPPPPTSGGNANLFSHSLNDNQPPPPSVGGAGPNPFAGGASALGNRRVAPIGRYVNYDPIRGALAVPLPPPPPHPAVAGRTISYNSAPNSVSLFVPNGVSNSSVMAPTQMTEDTPKKFSIPPLPPPPSIGSRTASYNNQMGFQSNQVRLPFSSPDQHSIVQPTPNNTPVVPTQSSDAFYTTPNRHDSTVTNRPHSSFENHTYAPPTMQVPKFDVVSNVNNASNIFLNGHSPSSKFLPTSNVEDHSLSTRTGVESVVTAVPTNTTGTSQTTSAMSSCSPSHCVDPAELFAGSLSKNKEEAVQDEEDDSMMDDIPLTPWPEERKDSLKNMHSSDSVPNPMTMSPPPIHPM